MKKFLLPLFLLCATAFADGKIRNADINSAAGIVDTKLATISTALKVSNSATTSTSANTVSAIVARDANGDFSARNITATSFIGAVTGNAATATAFAADPVDCAFGTFAVGIAANGDLTCATVGGGGGAIVLTDLSATAPIQYNNTTGVFSMPASTNSMDGYLSGADHTTFAAKQDTVSIGNFSASPSAKGLTLAIAAINLDPADATHPGGVSIGTQTFAGTKTFSSTVSASISGNAATATAFASNPTDCGSNAYTTAIDASGNLTCASITDASLSSNVVTSFGAVGSSPSANGATIAAQVATLQPADGTHPGVVTTGAQTFAGAKTFSTTIVGSVNGNAATVTTNANMTGDVTSVGNATTIGAGKVTNSMLSADNANACSTLTQCTTARTIDWSTAPCFILKLTSGSACTLTFSNPTAGKRIDLWLSNDSASSGTATLVWPTAKWFPAGAPVMTTGTSALDLCSCSYNGTSYACNCLQNGG